MASKTSLLSCTVEVQYLQQSLESYHEQTKTIVSTREFKDATKDFNKSQSNAASNASSAEQSQSEATQQGSQTEASASGSGYGVTVEASFSHSQSSSGSSASASASSLAASSQMANAFRLASTSATETEKTRQEEKTETVKFQAGFLQVIQKVETFVSINGQSASTTTEDLMNSVPVETPNSLEQLQQMAESFIARYDDGTGIGIIKGPKCIATKFARIVSEDRESLAPTATEQIRDQIKVLENQLKEHSSALQNQPSAAEHALINKRANTWLLAQNTNDAWIPEGVITFENVVTGSTEWPNTGSGTRSFTVPTTGTYEVLFSAYKYDENSGVQLKVNGTLKRKAYNNGGNYMGTLSALFSINLVAQDNVTFESIYGTSIHCDEQKPLIVKIILVK